MLRYALKRLLLTIPTIFLVSVIVFLAGHALDEPKDDPLDGQHGSFSSALNPENEAAKCAQHARSAHTDIPLFYFSIGINSLPDTFYRVCPDWRKKKLRQIALNTGRWEPVQEYEIALNRLFSAIGNGVKDSIAQGHSIRLPISKLVFDTESDSMVQHLNDLETALAGHEALLPLSGMARAKAEALKRDNGWGWPVFHWHGWPNQYHDWLTAKYADEAVSPWKKLRFPLRITLFIQASGLLLSILAGIPVGMFLAKRPNLGIRMGKRALMLLYVIPILLLACLLRFWFATPGHGLFSSFIGGIGTSTYNPEVQGFWAWIAQNKGRLLLPILTISAHFFAFTALQMRQSALATANQDFVRAARAKGLTERKIWQKHVFWNAMTPIYVILGNLLPALLAGSILVESIFNINGIGFSTITAVQSHDYPVLMTIVLLSATLTLLGSLLADLFLAWGDPRVRLK